MYDESTNSRPFWRKKWVHYTSLVLVASIGIFLLGQAVTVSAHDLKRMAEQGKHDQILRYVQGNLQSPKRADLVTFALEKLLDAKYAEVMSIVKEAMYSEQTDKTVLLAIFEQLQARGLTPFGSAVEGLDYYLQMVESMPAPFAPVVGNLLMNGGRVELEHQLRIRLREAHAFGSQQAASLARQLDNMQLSEMPFVHDLAQLLSQVEYDNRRLAELGRIINVWEQQVKTRQAALDGIAAEAKEVFPIDCYVHGSHWKDEYEVGVPLQPGTKAPTKCAILRTERALKPGEWYLIQAKITGTRTVTYSEQFGGKTEIQIEYEEVTRNLQTELDQAQANLAKVQMSLVTDQASLDEIQKTMPVLIRQIDQLLEYEPAAPVIPVPQAVKEWAEAFQPAVLGTRLEHGNYTYLLVTGGSRYQVEILGTEVAGGEIVVRAALTVSANPNYTIAVIPKTNKKVNFQSVTEDVFLGTLDDIPQDFRPIWIGPKIRYSQKEPGIIIGTSAKKANTGMILIEGVSLTYENTVIYALLDKDGAEISRSCFSPEVGTGSWHYFSLEVPKSGVSEVKLFEESARDGSDINIVVVTPQTDTKGCRYQGSLLFC